MKPIARFVLGTVAIGGAASAIYLGTRNASTLRTPERLRLMKLPWESPTKCSSRREAEQFADCRCQFSGSDTQPGELRAWSASIRRPASCGNSNGSSGHCSKDPRTAGRCRQGWRCSRRTRQPEVGQARADVLQRQADARIAQQNRDWQQSTCNGLKKLSEAIRKRTPVDSIRNDFKDVVLGKSRDQLLSAYSDLLLAETLVEAAQQNAQSGVFPARTIEERENSRDSKEAALLAGLEEQSFEAQQRCQQAAAQLADADRRFRISQQTVRTLLGQFEAVPDGDVAASFDEKDLSLVQLKAPFNGTIEKRVVSTSERVAPGDSLITLADTSTLWVAADLREREWNALALKSGDVVKVSTSIAGLESCSATVHFVGREVDPSTNAVPLVAIIENPSGKLRPGMFVRVSVPVAETKQAITVPESAIMEHDRQAFVFTPEPDAKFRRVDITPGIRAGGLVEVVSGLEDGQKVVAQGAFVLKSELLLQGESE